MRNMGLLCESTFLTDLKYGIINSTVENCPSRMVGKSKVVLKKHVFIEKCNKAAFKN
jgi:hypothetical protein